ncbi:MAG: 2-keto-3-deoxygluconate permease [Lachnospiraceae bacterium]|nr:2-keto-3-deoxygluconate permease [Lachnospiraceae bacterium]
MNENNKTMDLHILQRMNKIPGGMLVVALVISLLINNLFPGVFRIGGITQALFVEGGNALMGVFLICCGASLNIRQMGMPLYKGFILTAIKFFVGLGIGVLIGAVFGPAGVWGITPMVAIAALTNSNSSLYAILSGKYGDASDTGAISILSLNDGPFFTLVALGATGFASINITSVISVLLPLLIGILWGSFDSDFREICKKTHVFVMFFLMFPITANITVHSFVQAGIAGLLLGVLSTLLGFVFFFLFNLFLPKKERNAMGAAIGTTAGNAAITPQAVAAVDPAYATSVELSTSMIVSDGMVTFLCCPIVTAICDRYMRKYKKGIYSPEGRVGKEENK